MSHIGVKVSHECIYSNLHGGSNSILIHYTWQLLGMTSLVSRLSTIHGEMCVESLGTRLGDDPAGVKTRHLPA